MDSLVTFVPSMIGALLLSLVMLLTGRLPFLRRPGNVFLDIASGIAIAYVFVDILPHLAGKQMRLSGSVSNPLMEYLEHHVYLVALAGFCAYLGLELSLARAREIPGRLQREIANLPAVALFLAASIWLYAFFIGYMLAEQSTHSYEPTLLFAVAVSAHFIGLNHVFYHQRPGLFRGRLRIAYVIAPLAGCLTGMVTELSDATYAIGFSWLAGGVIGSAMSLELPRVHSRNQFWMFCGGAAGFSLLILLVEAVR